MPSSGHEQRGTGPNRARARRRSQPAPNGTTATLLSFSPLHAPFFLMIRIPYLSASPGTIAAFVWMVLCTAGLFRLMAAGFAQSILPSEAEAGIAQRLARLLRRSRRSSP